MTNVLPLRRAPRTSVLRELDALFERARAVDTRRFESRDPDAIAREHIPEITALLADARATLCDVATRYDGGGASIAGATAPGDDFSVHVDTLMRGDDTGTRVADLAIIARMELAQRLECIRRLPANASTWDIIAVTSSVRRRVLKSVSAIQKAICEHERLDREIPWFRAERERSLEVRRAYATFRRRLELERPPSRDELYARLRLVGTALAMLIGDDVYEHLRVTDRQLLRRLQEKVIQRLRVDPSSDGRAATREGERVWQDIATAAELLMQVNRRAELREHDAATLRRLTEELRPLSPRARVTPELRARLSSLMGADPAIDGLLLAPADALIPVGVLRPNVSRLLATAQQLGW
ncbi:MAG: hypothetical protein H6713_38405 [Myxococcales bacterium]|nr:hypothetical protein [Myxococcales bacterium]